MIFTQKIFILVWLVEFIFFLKSASTSPEVIRVTRPLGLGEGPHWDSKTKTLYFVDMIRSEIHKYMPERNKIHKSGIVVPRIGSRKKHVTLVVPLENQKNTFLIGHGGDLATVEWNGVSRRTKNYKTLCVLEKNYPKVRLNDGKVSPSGVIFVGSMGEKLSDNTFPDDAGSLFAYDPSTKKVKKLLRGIGISNGLTWSFDEKIFYFIDSLSGKVKAYDYDSKKISLSNERVIFDSRDVHAYQDNYKFPDGMTIDVRGNLWVPIVFGGQVYQINPNTKSVVSVIDFPCKGVTSVAFGGSNLEDLYVTSISYSLTKKEKKEQPSAGCLFKVTGLGTKGIEGVRANVTTY